MSAFTYANFSDDARDAVMTAADVALASGVGRVLPEHLQAAVDGAQRSGRPARELGRIPFDSTVIDVLSQAHDAAVAAGEAVDIGYLRAALSSNG